MLKSINLHDRVEGACVDFGSIILKEDAIEIMQALTKEYQEEIYELNEIIKSQNETIDFLGPEGWEDGRDSEEYGACEEDTSMYDLADDLVDKLRESGFGSEYITITISKGE